MQKIRDIVYLWDSNIGWGNDNQGVILSGKYVIEFNKENNNLYIQWNNDYIDGFWGENIHDCFAIVGDNGAGKTMLTNYIMEDIQTIKSPNLPSNEFIIIAECQQRGDLLVFCTKQFAEINLVADNRTNCNKIIVSNEPRSELDEFEIAYFHNALNYKDYFFESRCNYDFSLGRMINQHHKTTYEMHYDDLNKDKIKNYFDNDAFRIISFLYNYAMHNDLEIEFPVPKAVNISIANAHYSEDYILNEAKRLRVDKDKEESLSEAVYNFRKAVNNFVDIFGRTWINYTVKNLILNCFRNLCIPATVPNNISDEHMRFFEACAFLNNEKKIRGQNVYKCAYKVIVNVRKKFEDDFSKKYLDSTESFIRWIEKNESVIKKNEIEGIMQLYIVPEENTEEFMSGLLNLYSKMNFAFPFFDFSFGISTGEYYFLSVFSNIYSMVKSSYLEYNAYDYPKLGDNTKSILLIFDEADLSMHPRWQRMYMKWITDFCKQIFHDKYVKIVITTHSPILLSDFPANDVLYLKKNAKGKVFAYIGETNTFGSNIHTLFLNSFFLEDYGTMGAFAEEKINSIAGRLFEQKGKLENIEEIEKVISYIGEGIIREKLKDEMDKHEENKFIDVDSNGKKVINDTLRSLKEQRKYMNQLIENLERKIQ